MLLLEGRGTEEGKHAAGVHDRALSHCEQAVLHEPCQVTCPQSGCNTHLHHSENMSGKP